ncbi:MAG: LysR family transcriptional regulator [Hyphomicrobiales bacterium]|nr:MAG: LysR family transcriptional regulator [Hyphomicrobiales bacterium]
MIMQSLDIDLLRAFAAIADLGSFTAAADALDATQSGISIRIRKLEERLGRPVLARSPRRIELTALGQTMLPQVRDLLALHDGMIAATREQPAPRRISVGLSEHATGIHLPQVLAMLSQAGDAAGTSGIAASLTLGLTADLRRLYDDGALDIAVLRSNQPRPEEEVLFRDPMVWAASASAPLPAGGPVPLIALPKPCQIRQAAIAALDGAGMPWVEAFSGNGLQVVHNAVACGLGIAAIGRRNVTPGLRILGPEDGFPPLPESAVVLLCRSPDKDVRALARRVAQTLKKAEGGRAFP